MMNKDLHSTKKKHWWSKLKAPFRSKKGKYAKKDKEEDGLRRKLNVNEEYKEVFRTKSYVEIWSKVQDQLKGSSSIATPDHKRSPFSSSSSSSSPFSSSSNHPSTSTPRPFYMHLSDCLLEPRQETVMEAIKSSKLNNLLKDYFEASLDAYNICELLLRGIQKTRSHHRLIKRVIRLSKGGEEMKQCNYTADQCHEMVIQELASFARLSNPLSMIVNGAVDFNQVHDDHGHLLRKLTSRRRRIRRREKFIKFYKKAAGYGFLICYTVLAVALVSLALHSVVGLLGVPGLLLPFSTGVIKKVGGEGLKTSFLERQGAQLDIAAKGAYILINDFDTVGRLVTRLHDEVEHRKAIAEMCVRNRNSPEVVKEAVREFHMHEDGFVDQLEELEEHIYLCFLTINRSRRMVIQEILGT